jgi:DNA-binding NarL/FixJ family response regulator
MKIRLLVACRNTSLGLELAGHCAHEQGGAFASQIESVAKLAPAAAALRPDVLLLEYSLCGKEPHSVIAPLLRVSPGTRIILLCEVLSQELLLSFVRLGVSGCLLTRDPPSLLVKAVQAVHAGETWFGRSALVQALRSLVGPPAAAPVALNDQLTDREEEIFHLMGRGLTNKEIARNLDISDHTVKTHLHRIYVKLHQSGRYKALLSHPTTGLRQ